MVQAESRGQQPDGGRGSITPDRYRRVDLLCCAGVALALGRGRSERAITAEKNMEGLLARGLARPLDPEGHNKQTLSVAEAEALWEMARLGDTDIGLRFLDEATEDLR